MGRKAFSLAEILIVLSIVAILAAIAIPQLHKYRDFYAYQEYASSLELTVRQAKILAMERTTNIGVCVRNAYSVRVVDMGVRRNADICSETTISALNIKDADRDNTRFVGSGLSIDPRGFAIQSGGVCVQNTRLNSHLLVCVSRFGSIKTQRGSGPCPNSCS
ncbi:MAG: prepilin-type N-terminal cleavage/methylation domain-containing protein [Aquificaceae bacterium]|nr:prepilin-type N-terminal cleavage/methylation domain-containing protein [Aquificaceae bacterium]